MTFKEFFRLDNKMHMSAFNTFYETGAWPHYFLEHLQENEIELPLISSALLDIMDKITREYLNSYNFNIKGCPKGW